MLKYFLRKILYAIPTLIGVNFITFFIFFIVNSPDDMARIHLGAKYVSAEQIWVWKKNHGYDKPLFYNELENGFKKITNTLFFTGSVSLMQFDFGISDTGRNIGYDIRQRMWPSLLIAAPTFFLSIFVNISFAFLMLFFRKTPVEYLFNIGFIAMMSISGLFYIIFGQFLLSKMFRWFPVSGYESGVSGIKFLILPVIISLFSRIGGEARWYYALFLEELYKDHIRTARAKGVSEFCVLFRHVFRNSLIPISTGVVVMIPSLFLGSLLVESFFGIPGLGSYTIDAIAQQDFSVLKSMVFLGAFFYILGILLSDFVYIFIDPRVRLK
jgi:peptide/nickel transport system permease protein